MTRTSRREDATAGVAGTGGQALAGASAGIRRRRERRLAISMILPAVVVVAGVYVYPALATGVYSLARIDPATFDIERFVGLSHYISALQNPAFTSLALRTIYFGVAITVITVVLSLLIALLLNQKFRGRGVLVVVVLLPWALPPIVSGVLWGQMFHAEFGFINGLIRAFGGAGNTIWLGEPNLALHAVVTAEVWRWIPFATLFLLAGLQTVPRMLHDAAAVDGAGVWQRFRHLTLPLLGPVVIPVSIFLFVVAMKAFDTIFVLTRGGPARGTTTLNYLVYQQGFVQFRFSQASSTAYILMLVTLVAIAVLGLFRMRARAQEERVKP